MSRPSQPDPSAARALAPSGRLRAAINFGNPVLAQRGPDGAPAGVSADLARELARRLSVPLDFVAFEAAGKVVDAVADDVWDVAFLAFDPLRADQISFTAPYVVIEGTYIVGVDSPYLEVADLDRDGVRIAVGQGAAYDLFLSRHLQKARLVRAPTSEAAVELFVREGLEAAAGVRQPLEREAASRPTLRVVPGCFTKIQQAMGLPRRRDAGLAWLHAFVEAMKAGGFVAEALQRSGQQSAQVAPAAPLTGSS